MKPKDIKAVGLNKDSPLRCEVVGKVLIITIGVDTLVFADRERTGLEVTSASGFAEDVARGLDRQDEIGATPLTDLLDDAMEDALDNGSVHVDHEKTERNRKEVR